MKKGYVVQNGIVRIHKEAEGHIKAKIPTAIYSVKYNDMMDEYYLEEDKKKYKIGKIYGTVQQNRAKRIMNAYKYSDKSLGVLLSGLKGTGKTVLIKLIANEAVDMDIPVVTVSSRYLGDSFNSFIESLGECVILFDEFTKVYKKVEEQEYLLTLFDGLNSTKRLSILTSNEPRQISEFFIDRPGRILYHFEYDNLDVETFLGYVDDNLKAVQYLDDIKRSYETSHMFTFDILQTLVHECNENAGMEYRDIVNPLNITALRAKKYYKVIKVELAGDETKPEGELWEWKKDDKELLLEPFYLDFELSQVVNTNELFKLNDRKATPEEKMDRLDAYRKSIYSRYFELSYMDFKHERDGIRFYKDKDGYEITMTEVWK